MKKDTYKIHVFDEIVRLITVIGLFLFGAFLVATQSELARDVILLIIGVVGGKYLRG